jgi:O-methyltransferase involved in polyketide biosynthesis
MYLTRDSIETMLRVVGTCAQGSEIVLSYNQQPQYLDDVGREFLTAIAPRAGAMGEPLQSSFSPREMEELVDACGLSVAEHPTADELRSRYCAGRTDGLRPYTLERLIAARWLTRR